MSFDDYYQIITLPTVEPVTLSEAKSWLRVENTADDVLIASLITTSRLIAENYCNRIFPLTSISCYFYRLDISNFEPFPFIHVRRAPLASLTSVEIYIDGNYTATTDYLLKNSTGFPRILFENGIESDIVIYPIKVNAVFGYSVMPSDIKTAILSNIAYFYENRGDVLSEGKLSIPLESKAIYNRYRIMDTF